MLIRALRLARKPEMRAVDLKEVMNMLSLFVVDDDILEFFLNVNIASDLFFYMKEDRIDRKAGVVNLITIMIHLFRLKSYAFSRTLKIDFMVFVFKQYEKTEDEEFKTDLLQLLSTLYQIKEFRKLLNDEEVLIELKYRTDIVEIEELITNELEDERRMLERQKEIEIAQGKHKPRKKFDTDWVEQFKRYKIDPMENIALLQNEVLAQVERDELLKVQKEENEGILLENKAKGIQEFLTELRIRGPNGQTSDKAKKAAEDLADIKDLIIVQHENIFYRAKSKMADLKKENEKMRSLLILNGINFTNAEDVVKELESTKNKLPPKSGLVVRAENPNVVYGRLPSLGKTN